MLPLRLRNYRLQMLEWVCISQNYFQSHQVKKLIHNFNFQLGNILEVWSRHLPPKRMHVGLGGFANGLMLLYNVKYTNGKNENIEIQGLILHLSNTICGMILTTDKYRLKCQAWNQQT